MPRVAFTTLGCKVNQFETEAIEGLFKQRGYQVVDFSGVAEVYVINTCSVTQLGERKSRQLIRRAERQNPEAVIVVTGCYAQASPDQVSAIAGVSVIVGTQDRQRIVDLAEEAGLKREQIRAVTDIMSAREFEDIPLFDVPGRTRAFLKIQEGCTNYCTYCIIPYTRGPLRSRPLDSIEREARKLIAAGFKEIVLTGIHLGAYGRDTGHTLTDAVRVLLGIPELVRLRLGSLESVEVPEELIDLMTADARFCPHLHLPLQAGDDNVLRLMNREYTAGEYRDLIEKIRARVPGIAITTDIIVGFPGETEEMFQNTLVLAQTLAFAKVHIFPYSRREGTPAAKFPGQLSNDEKHRRVKALEQIADTAALRYHKQFIGEEMDVLFELGTPSHGYTCNYIHVFVDEEIPAKTLRRVRLMELHRDGIWGRQVE